jgi:mannan polymerase II complex MNN10 subunit
MVLFLLNVYPRIEKKKQYMFMIALFFGGDLMKFRAHFLLFLLLVTTTFAYGQIGVVSIAAGENYKKLVEAGMANKEAYCLHHGYDWMFSDQVEDPSRKIYWSKIALLQRMLDSTDYEWLVWIDADAMVMNFGHRLEDFIDEDYHLIIGEDMNGINSGIFFIRNCEWSKQFLQDVYNRTDCLSHHWPEQHAIDLEIHRCKENRAVTKIVPQRTFNSFCPELQPTDGLKVLYQPGDFILHFASAYQFRVDLSALFNKYLPQVIDDRTLPTVDQFLGYYGFELCPEHSSKNEGYISALQAKKFQSILKKYPEIRSIAEIGLNGGHSAEVFFNSCPNLEKFVSFDIQAHPYAKVAVEYFKMKHKERFEFVSGNSRKTVPQYAERFQSQKFDLIYIDGDNSNEGCKLDILHSAHLAHKNTLLWVDDYNAPGVKDAVDLIEEAGIIQILQIHEDRDAKSFRCWVEARYNF